MDDCVNATCGIGTCVDGLGNFTCDCGVFAQGDQCESYAKYINSIRNLSTLEFYMFMEHSYLFN